jgi:Flp pilus assembly protein TadD
VIGVLAIAGCGGDEPDPLADIAALQDAGRFAESIEPLRARIERDPDLAEAHYRLGVALARTGQRSLAVWPL